MRIKAKRGFQFSIHFVTYYWVLMVQKMEILLKPSPSLKYLQVSLPQWLMRTEIYSPHTHILTNLRGN